MINKKTTKLLSLILFSIIFVAEADLYIDSEEDKKLPSVTSRDIGEYGFPTDPLADRAQGMLLKGKVKNAVSIDTALSSLGFKL